jgi:hypothetical protein
MSKRLRLEFSGWMDHLDRMGWWNYGHCAQGDEIPGEKPEDTIVRLAQGLGRRKKFHVEPVPGSPGTYYLCTPKTKKQMHIVRIAEVKSGP